LLKFQESSGITPKALENRPDLAEHLKFYWAVFDELSGLRTYSDMGSPRPIFLREFLDYAGLWQFTRLETQDCWRYVRLIDKEWIELFSKRQPEIAKTSKTKTPK
jgi:hypothetical protein